MKLRTLSEDPKCAKSNTLAKLPSRLKLRNDMELARQQVPEALSIAPTRACCDEDEPSDQLDPHFVTARTLSAEENDTKSNADNADPSLEKLRIDMLEPRHNVSITESFIMEPIFHDPNKLNEDPHLALLRNDIEDESTTKSNALNAEPMREKLRQDTALPQCTNEAIEALRPTRANDRIEMDEPKFANSATERTDPRRAKLRIDNDDPSCTKSTMDS
jgi:hypothetical protein